MDSSIGAIRRIVGAALRGLLLWLLTALIFWAIAGDRTAESARTPRALHP